MVAVFDLEEALPDQNSNLSYHCARPEYGAMQLDAVAEDLFKDSPIFQAPVEILWRALARANIARRWEE